MKTPGHPIRKLSTPNNTVRSLYEMISIYSSYPVDFIDDERIISGKLKDIKALFIIDGVYMNASILEHLKNYVKNGGKLFLMRPFAQYNEYGRKYNTLPGGGFDKIIGECKLLQGKSPACDAHGKFLNKVLNNRILQYVSFSPEHANTQVLAKYIKIDTPAIISAKYGNGKIFCFGFPACAETDYQGMLAKFVCEIMDKENIHSPVAIKNLSCSRKVAAAFPMKDSNGEDWLLLNNPQENPQYIELTWNTKDNGKRIINVLNGKTWALNKNEGKLILKIKLK